MHIVCFVSLCGDRDLDKAVRKRHDEMRSAAVRQARLRKQKLRWQHVEISPDVRLEDVRALGRAEAILLVTPLPLPMHFSAIAQLMSRFAWLNPPKPVGRPLGVVVIGKEEPPADYRFAMNEFFRLCRGRLRTRELKPRAAKLRDAYRPASGAHCTLAQEAVDALTPEPVRELA